MYERPIHLGSRLHYPVTVARILKKPGDEVKKQDHIMMYKFQWKRMIDDERWSTETTYTEFESSVDGVIKEWRIKEGDVIHADMVGLVVEETCPHETQLFGMCTVCGADMTEANWASETSGTERANINMSHDHTGLKVSQNVARRAEHNAQKTLLRQRKLSLVVDLDQTIIHACVDPTIDKWKNDPSSPNHAVVQDIRSFWLDDATGGQTYYIKMRPGLEEFLEEMSTMYEMHVYTMGTRAYAQNIARFIDPDKKLFGNRVISRNENGGNSTKQLQRLFPVSTDMVVIIDDRADVWPNNERNLIKVVPFDFFKGQGDLNSPFAPQPQTAAPTTAPDEKSTSDANDDGDSTNPSPIETLGKLGAEDEATLSTQKQEHDKAVEKQLNERPLMHMQEELDKESESDSSQNAQSEHRLQLLVDDDEELVTLQDHLTDVHKAFYETYDRNRQERRESDQPQHLPGQTKLRRKSIDDGVDLSLVPDVGDVMSELKTSVLEGLVLVLSGLVPLGVSVEQSEIGRQALAFGAQVLDEVSSGVTHLVVATSRPRTKKVQQAAKIPSIKIVNQNWLSDCLSQWRRLHEAPYLMEILDVDRGQRDDTADPVSEDDGNIVADDFDWAAGVDEELDALLEEDSSTEDDEAGDDEEDDNSNASDSEGGESEENQTDSESKGTKRKMADTGDESDAESVLAKKQRLARSRGASALRTVRTANGSVDEPNGAADGESAAVPSSLPTPGPTGDEEDGAAANPDNQEDFDDDDLEKELLAEFDAVDD
jgi:RNA polymerase II subunit A-like phosphatase